MAVMTVNLALILSFYNNLLKDYSVFLNTFGTLFVVYTLYTVVRYSRYFRMCKEEGAAQYHKSKNDLFIFLATFFLSFSLLLFIFTDRAAFSYNGVEIAISLINFVVMFKLLSSNKSFVVERRSVFNQQRGIQTVSGGKRAADETKSEEIRERLVALFENQKPYLRSDLTIQEVALSLYTNKTYLSRVINDYYCHNFNQFVNYYRIEEARRLFMNDRRLTIQQMCDLSGFGSMATFTIAFRFFVGRSPAEWCKDQKIRLSDV